VSDFDLDGMYERLLTKFGERELKYVRREVGSRTLKKAMKLLVELNKGRARLYIPHYWALYYHDGHGTITPKRARKLVFFDNPKDDPRLDNGKTPEREAQVGRLTKQQYQDGVKRNRKRAARGQRPFMYVVDSVGPTPGDPFFERASGSASARADAFFEKEVARELRGLTRDLDERDTLYLD
jgi:hypothetical protein